MGGILSYYTEQEDNNFTVETVETNKVNKCMQTDDEECFKKCKEERQEKRKGIILKYDIIYTTNVDIERKGVVCVSYFSRHKFSRGLHNIVLIFI